MTFELCYDIAEYLGKVNRGKPTARELAIAAYEYKCDWEGSLKIHKATYGLIGLITILKENAKEGDDEAKTILEEIEYVCTKWKIKLEV